jgi:hypothetical protein
VAAAVAIETGFVIAYRIYEVGDEIDLAKAEKLVARDATRLKLSREGSQYIEFPNPPITVTLGPRPLKLKSGIVQVETSARIFDHGAISLTVRVPIPPNQPWASLVSLADEVYDSPAVEALGRAEVEVLQKTVASATGDPHSWDSSESYTVVFATRVSGASTPTEILANADVARLLLGETATRPLSEREQYDVTKHAFSYLADDLVVVDWNSAFVFEPTGSMDIPDILEIANAQLLELRYFDWLLDRELATIWDAIEGARALRWYQVLRSPYGALARRVMALFLELSEYTERVENSLKNIGDFYLSRVYRAAVRRFRIPEWQGSVYRKLSLLERVYTLLKGEVDTRRSQFLEITIVLLIVVEIVLAFGAIHP